MGDVKNRGVLRFFWPILPGSGRESNERLPIATSKISEASTTNTQVKLLERTDAPEPHEQQSFLHNPGATLSKIYHMFLHAESLKMSSGGPIYQSKYFYVEEGGVQSTLFCIFNHCYFFSSANKLKICHTIKQPYIHNIMSKHENNALQKKIYNQFKKGTFSA